MTRLSGSEGFTTPGGGLAAWHGPAPRLATANKFESYGYFPLVREGGVQFGYIYFRAAPTTIKAPTLDITMQFSSDAAVGYYTVYVVRLDEPVGMFGGTLITEDVAFVETNVPANTWVTHTFRLTAGVDYNQEQVEAVLASGRFGVLASVNPSATPQNWFLSQLVVDIGGNVTYLRNHARDDGLGGNAPRNHPRTSQQRSLRNKGYR